MLRNLNDSLDAKSLFHFCIKFQTFSLDIIQITIWKKFWKHCQFFCCFIQQSISISGLEIKIIYSRNSIAILIDKIVSDLIQ